MSSCDERRKSAWRPVDSQTLSNIHVTASRIAHTMAKHLFIFPRPASKRPCRPARTRSLAFHFSTSGASSKEHFMHRTVYFTIERQENRVKIRAGYDIAFNCFRDVPMVLMLSVHPSRQHDLLTDN